jgi:UDP-galactopyranose mutase
MQTIMNDFKYDYLIVGSGLFGAIFAHELNKHGKRCLIIDKRAHAGGNVHCKKVEGITVHAYGAHIFHTSDKNIWEYINRFAEFNHFVNSPLANSNGTLYNLPFNMNTFYQLWGTKTPAEARDKIQIEISKLNLKTPCNLEEQAISLVGLELYEKLIKHYTEKQWGRSAKSLPSFIIKRLPLRFTYNNNYFDDIYQGIPIGGYNKIIDNLIKGIEIRTNTDFFSNRLELSGLAEKIVFTGKIDEYYDYKFGDLEYRSLGFREEIHNLKDFQGNAVVNYCDKDIPYTRIIEHKHFEFGQQDKTVISREYPIKGSRYNEPFYPINDVENSLKNKNYQKLAAQESNVIFGGRLAEYRYYDMHQIIASALHKVKNELGREI